MLNDETLLGLSIVATLYQSESYVEEFCARCSNAARARYGDDYEIILVNDGSPDASVKVAIEQSKSDPKIKVIDLARNYGHHRAIMAGLEHSQGEVIFLIDSDLEELPEWLDDFAHQLGPQSGPDQVDVVYGVQPRRKGSWFELFSGNVFYSLFNWVAQIDLPRNLTTARLMRRDYVNALLSHKERDYFIAGLWVITGFNQQSIKVKKLSHSKSAYSIARRISLMISSILTFSTMPLIGLCVVGMLTAILAMIVGGWTLAEFLIKGTKLNGWTSMILSIWFLGGLNVFAVGLLGLYISKILLEVKNRPNNIVRAIYQGGSRVKRPSQ